VRPEGLRQLKKIPITPSGIEPFTFRLAAQCLNQLRNNLLFVIPNNLEPRNGRGRKIGVNNQIID
jgi:hypothetical protein